MKKILFSRMDFMKGMTGLALSSPIDGCLSGGKNDIYPAWKFGELDIHHIHTGVGEQTFFIFPDGTSLLLDCGNESRPDEYVAAIPPCPSGDRRGGEWVRRYIERLTSRREIDYLMVSHWHADHTQGIPDVAGSFCFRNFLCRQSENRFQYRNDVSPESIEFVTRWLASAKTDGMAEIPFEVGALNQIALLHDESKRFARSFGIRNLAANGKVWLGAAGVRDCAGEHVRATGIGKIPENMLSTAVLIRYGRFRYFSGGDIEREFVASDGTTYSYEGLVGLASGPVDVCKTNHHAYWNAMQKPFVKAVCPRVFVSSSWSPNQINDRNLPIMTSHEIYEGERTVYFGCLPAEKIRSYANRMFMRDVSPACGHVVIKVTSGGDVYTVFVLDPHDESMRILSRQTYRTGVSCRLVG